MSREIKFRVWDKRQSTMCYEPAVPWFITQETLLNDVFQDTDLIYMQYTGLKDKNGKKIYEGDVIKSTYSGSGAPLYFDSRSIVQYDDWDAGFLPFFRYRLMGSKEFEIIGNIHENPELLP